MTAIRRKILTTLENPTREEQVVRSKGTAEGFKSDLHDIFSAHSLGHSILSCDTVLAARGMY